MKISEIREKYPEYNDMSDDELVHAYHDAYYSDMPFERFSTLIGYQGVVPGGGLPREIPEKLTGKPYSQLTKADILPALGSATGDILGTILAPEAKALSIGGKAVNMLSRVGGSATGSFLGTLGGQLASGQDPDIKEASKQAAVGALSETGLSMAGAPIKFIYSKFGRPIAEIISDITFLGSAAKAKFRQDIIRETTERATNFVEDLAPQFIKNQEVPIKDISLMVNQALDDVGFQYKAYEDLIDTVSGGDKIIVDEAAQFIGDLKEKARKALLSENKKEPTESQVITRTFWSLGTTKAKAGDVLTLLSNDKVTPAQMKNLLARALQFGQKGDAWFKLGAKQQANREALKDSLMKDLEKMSPEAKKLRDDADETFKSVIRFRVISNIFKKSMSEDIAGNKTLQPMNLVRHIYQNRKIIERDMPDLWPRLEKEAQYFLKVAPEFSKEASQFVTGPGQVISRGLGGAAGGYMFGRGGVPLVETLGLISAYAVMSKKDKKLLKKVLRAAVTALPKTGLHMGGQAINFGTGQWSDSKWSNGK